MATTSERTRLSEVHSLTLTQIMHDAREIAAKKANANMTARMARRIQQYALAVISESDSPKCAGIPLAAIDDQNDRDAVATLTQDMITAALVDYARTHAQPRNGRAGTAYPTRPE